MTCWGWPRTSPTRRSSNRPRLRRMSKVRQHQIGPHSDVSQEILAELARARLVLIDSDRRADYDAKLRARGESRPDLSAAAKKLVVVEAASSVVRHPSADGPDILATIRTGDDSRDHISAAAGMNLTGVARQSVVASADEGLNVLASIATQGRDGSLSVRSTKNKPPAVAKKRLFVVSFLSSHVAIIAVFFVFRFPQSRFTCGLFSAELIRPPRRQPKTRIHLIRGRQRRAHAHIRLMTIDPPRPLGSDSNAGLASRSRRATTST